jgi:hypothetical protein
MATEQRWPLARDGLAVISIGLGLFVTALLLLPTDGRLATPVRDGLWQLLGRAALGLPVGMVLVGVLALYRSLVPSAALPTSRLLGLALLVAAVVPAQHFVELGASGVAGQAVGALLLDLLGGVGTALLLGLLLVIGALLTFDVAVVDLVRFRVREGDVARN